MKSLRKSLNGNRDSSSRPQISTPTPLPAVSKPPAGILPPQKVIRALSHYRSQAPQELSFVKGDFFYVLKDVDTAGSWYEAHNPVSGARGLVPRSMFEEFGKNAAASRTSQAGLPSPRVQPPSAQPPNMRPPSEAASKQSPVYYAIVLHDFNAERPDELDAKRGDAISVVAQSNREWFVAKPIGRLGRPGLIPVSFVEIHDPATGQPVPDVDSILDRGGLPKVEDWKRAMLSYKQNSISLGVIDAPTNTSVSKPPSMYSAHQTPPAPPISSSMPDSPRGDSPEPLPEGILLSADVVSFHYEMEDYWFRIDAMYQPYGVPGQTSLPPSKQLILFRQYNDFYDFQVSLLETFPREAGREPPEPRTLPFMPGPADNVDDKLSATRRSELDDYIHALCAFGRTGARYILEHPVVRKFLSLKPGDVENEGPAKTQEIDALFANDPLDEPADESYDIQEQMGRLNVQQEGRSPGSDYHDEGYGASSQRNHYNNEPNPYHQSTQRHQDDLRLHAHVKNHSRSGSSASFNNNYGSNSRSNSPRNASPPPRHQNGYGSSVNGQHHHQPSTSSRRNDSGYQTEASRTSQAVSSRSRSHSTATTNINTPPISAANPQTAFVKIKVFNQNADDLIAIRVHPKISHSDLMDKVQTRLATEVGELRYRDSLTNTFVGLDSDQELRAWMEGTDKHVLYAD